MTTALNVCRVAVFGAQSKTQLPHAALRTLTTLHLYGESNYELYCYEDVIFEISTNHTKAYLVTGDGRKTDLREFDTVYLRSPANEPVRAAVARYCQHFGVRIINSENCSLPLTSKLVQYVVAALNGIAIPDTFYCDDPVKRSDYASDFFGMSQGGYVIKSVVGSNGRDNVKAKNLAELPNMSGSVIQRFVSNSYEYRVIIVNDEVALAYKKVNIGKAYQNNIARGGIRELVTLLPPEVCEMAIRMANLSQREVAAVDIVYDEEEKVHRLFEINFSYGHPDFEMDSNEIRKYGSLLANLMQKKGSRK